MHWTARCIQGVHYLELCSGSTLHTICTCNQNALNMSTVTHQGTCIIANKKVIVRPQRQNYMYMCHRDGTTSYHNFDGRALSCESVFCTSHSLACFSGSSTEVRQHGGFLTLLGRYHSLVVGGIIIFTSSFIILLPTRFGRWKHLVGGSSRLMLYTPYHLITIRPCLDLCCNLQSVEN